MVELGAWRRIYLSFVVRGGSSSAGGRCARGLPAVHEVRLYQGHLRNVLPVHGGSYHPRLHHEGECSISIPLRPRVNVVEYFRRTDYQQEKEICGLVPSCSSCVLSLTNMVVAVLLFATFVWLQPEMPSIINSRTVSTQERVSLNHCACLTDCLARCFMSLALAFLLPCMPFCLVFSRMVPCLVSRLASRAVPRVLPIVSSLVLFYLSCYISCCLSHCLVLGLVLSCFFLLCFPVSSRVWCLSLSVLSRAEAGV